MTLSLTDLAKKAEYYGLKVIMKEMKLSGVEDFCKVLLLLLEIGYISSDFSDLIKEGSALLGESAYWRYEKDESKTRANSFVFTMSYYDDILTWNDYELRIQPGFCSPMTVFVNEKFVNDDMKSVAKLLSQSDILMGGTYVQKNVKPF